MSFRGRGTTTPEAPAGFGPERRGERGGPRVIAKIPRGPPAFPNTLYIQ
jgi:hypothetical protein